MPIILSPTSSNISVSSISSLSPYSPIKSITLSPTYPIYSPTYPIYSPFNTVTKVYSVLPSYNYDLDTGLNDSFLAQKQMTNYLLYRILDKWLYDDDMQYILKYMKIENGKVFSVKSESEYEKNDVKKDSTSDIEKKANYIEEHYLDMSQMKKLLIRLIEELGYKWFELANKEKVVIEVVGKYLKKEFRSKF